MPLLLFFLSYLSDQSFRLKENTLLMKKSFKSKNCLSRKLKMCWCACSHTWRTIDQSFISRAETIAPPDPIPGMLNQLSEFFLKQAISMAAEKELYAVSGLIVGVILFRLQDGIDHSADFLVQKFIHFLEVKKYKIILL